MAPVKQRSTKQNRLRSRQPTVALNPLKKRRRDLKRLLQRAENLPADVKIGYERELASCEYDLQEAQKEAQKQQMIGKYHMVRFFERKRASRLLKQAEKRLAEAGHQDKTSLEKEVHNLRVDLNHAMYYPLDQAYSSIYNKSSDKGEGSGNGYIVNREHRMWSIVEKAMEDGTLQDLRDGKIRVDGSGDKEDEEKSRVDTQTRVKHALSSRAGKDDDHQKRGDKDVVRERRSDSEDVQDGTRFFET